MTLSSFAIRKWQLLILFTMTAFPHPWLVAARAEGEADSSVTEEAAAAEATRLKASQAAKAEAERAAQVEAQRVSDERAAAHNLEALRRAEESQRRAEEARRQAALKPISPPAFEIIDDDEHAFSGYVNSLLAAKAVKARFDQYHVRDGVGYAATVGPFSPADNEVLQNLRGLLPATPNYDIAVNYYPTTDEIVTDK